MPYPFGADWRVLGIPVDTNGNPLGHSGGDPIEVSVQNQQSQATSVGQTMNTENADDVTPVTFPLGPGNEVTRAICDPIGVQFTHPYPPQIWSASAEYALSQTDEELRAAPGFDHALFVTSVYCAAKGAVEITLKADGADFVWAYYAQVAGDGAMCNFHCPLRLPDDTALTVTTSADEDVAVVVSGFISYVGAGF